SLTRGIGELLRLLDPGLSDLVRTPQSAVCLALWPATVSSTIPLSDECSHHNNVRYRAITPPV
ncbi:hypothetical protein, partial [Aeromonas caviae]